MLSRDKLMNIVLFMDRTTVTGKEAFAWTETYVDVAAEIKAIDDLKAINDKLAKEQAQTTPGEASA